jgi:hypothetical protein
MLAALDGSLGRAPIVLVAGDSDHGQMAREIWKRRYEVAATFWSHGSRELREAVTRLRSLDRMTDLLRRDRARRRTEGGVMLSSTVCCGTFRLVRNGESDVDTHASQRVSMTTDAATAARRGCMNEQAPVYLCYDLRAIQSYIFRVPKLKYIVGGSALVDRFDRETVPALVKGAGASLVYAAGGKGAVRCASGAQASSAETSLRKEAGRLGLDIRFGRDADFSTAAHASDRLYPFVPELADGHPCELSGLYPVAGGHAGAVHASIKARIFDKGSPIGKHFENRLLAQKPDVGPGLAGRPIRFLSNIEPEDSEGRAGLASLGRNRWAIICMDGNDMGRQFREASKLAPNALEQWILHMSKALDTCAVRAARAGIERVVRLWSKDRGNSCIDECAVDGEVVVPIRPLVVGGDDIVVICHPAYAFDFVEAATEAWSRSSTEQADAYGKSGGLGLWPATGGTLSISAGVLFCPASLPIHTAVPYAETLLASAKHLGRSRPRANAPAPSSIDWESIIESVIDTPAARRARELRFEDGDVPRGEPGSIVELTQRPYGMDELADLRSEAARLSSVPRAIRNDILPSLRQGCFDRSLFRMRVAKNHPALSELLDESGGNESAWRLRDKTLSTWLPDALSLLEESERHDSLTSEEALHA